MALKGATTFFPRNVGGPSKQSWDEAAVTNRAKRAGSTRVSPGLTIAPDSFPSVTERMGNDIGIPGNCFPGSVLHIVPGNLVRPGLYQTKLWANLRSLPFQRSDTSSAWTQWARESGRSGHLNRRGPSHSTICVYGRGYSCQSLAPPAPPSARPRPPGNSTGSPHS